MSATVRVNSFSTIRQRSGTRLALGLVAVLAAACTGQAPASVAAPSARASEASTAPTTRASVSPSPVATAAETSDAWLAVGRAGEEGLTVLLAGTGEHLFDLPSGVPDAMWGRVVSATPRDTKTVVQDLVVQPGYGGPSRTLDGSWRLPTLGIDRTPLGVSADGQTIVLVEDAADPTTGAAIASTRFAILRRSLAVEPRIVTLPGAFEYDTLSPDGSILFVVERLPGPPDRHYQVRAVETATGTLRKAVVVDKTVGDEVMAGSPLAQVAATDGMVYTLYQGAEHPFVHALNTIDTWAICIDLPPSNGGDATSDWGLVLAADGASLVAVNAKLGQAVEVGTKDLAVRRTVTFTPSAATAISLAKFGHQAGGPVGRRLVASPDGSVLYAAGPGGIVKIATGDLTLAGRLLVGAATEALAVTPDGETIYALIRSGGRIVRLDAATGAIVDEVPGDGYDRLVAVVPR